MIERCKECKQPVPSEDMRGTLCRWCLDSFLSNDFMVKEEYSRRLRDGFDMLNWDSDSDDVNEILDGFQILDPYLQPLGEDGHDEFEDEEEDY